MVRFEAGLTTYASLTGHFDDLLIERYRSVEMTKIIQAGLTRKPRNRGRPGRQRHRDGHHDNPQTTRVSTASERLRDGIYEQKTAPASPVNG